MPLVSPLIRVIGFLWALLAASAADTIQDVLRNRGLPAGLLPKAVKSFNLDDNGLLEVVLEGPCLAMYDNRVFFDSVVRANLSYGELTHVVGLSSEELFLWLPVKGIVVSDPSSGLILFDIGVAHKPLSLSLFEDPPECNPQDPKSAGAISLPSGIRMEKDAMTSKQHSVFR